MYDWTSSDVTTAILSGASVGLLLLVLAKLFSISDKVSSLDASHTETKKKVERIETKVFNGWSSGEK